MEIKLNKNKILNLYAPILLFLIAFIWKFFHIGARDISIDEPFTIFNAQKSLREILLLPTQNEPNPPLFMIILHFWIKIFGISPYSVRIIPLIFNASTTTFLYLAGKKIMNYWSGFIAAGMFILSSYQFYFGMETRTYSLLLCATAASIYFLFSLLKEPGRKINVAGLIISNIALVYSHYFGWFVVFMQLGTALIYFKNTQAFKRVLFALGATGVAFIPMAITFVKQFLISKDHSWMRPPEVAAYWREITMFMNHSQVIFVVISLFMIGTVLLFFGKNNNKIPSEIFVLFFFWIIPFSIMFLVSAKVPMFENRYVMYNSIGLYLFVGTLTGYLFGKWKILAPLSASIILIFMGITLQTKIEFIAHREVKQAVNYLKEKTGGKYITIVYPHWADFGFAYYYDQSIFKDISNFETHLRDNAVYQVWGLDDAKIYIEKHRNRNIAFFKDGMRDNSSIENYLDSTYVRTDSAFFEDCFQIYLYNANLNPDSPPAN